MNFSALKGDGRAQHSGGERERETREKATCAVCALASSLQVAQSKAPLGWWLVVIGLHSPLATEV